MSERHEIGEIHGDGHDPTGYLDWIQPNCTCGWVGRKVHAYNNWQWTLVHQQKVDHLETARKKNLEVTNDSM